MKKLVFSLIFVSLLPFYLLSQSLIESREIYSSENLIITRISANSYIHTSFKQTNDYGNVPCNGLIVTDNSEAVVFDTPTNDSASVELIKWINDSLKCKISAVIPTHFHDDCTGGLHAFDKKNIPSYANHLTIELAKMNNLPVPGIGFSDSSRINFGNEYVVLIFPGEGHTKDNIVGYFPAAKVLFGGCLLKELDAGKGYLGDANVAEWSETVERVKNRFPDVQTVVPGHGESGSKDLLDYTINLFRVR